MPSRVIVFGTGSMAEVVHFYLTHDSPHEVAAFTVHERYLDRRELLGLPVVPYETLEDVYPPDDFRMYIAVGPKGLNQVRAALLEEVKARGYGTVGYLSSKCTHWGDTRIGEHCFIFEDNTIQPYVSIGDNVIIWSGNHIGHHATIQDHCFITSHCVFSGHSVVGRYSFVGVNATVRDGCRIGESNVIGAGTLIMKPTKDRAVYIGKRSEPDARTSDQIRM